MLLDKGSSEAFVAPSMILAGHADQAMAELYGVDFLVVDAAAMRAAVWPRARGQLVVRHSDRKQHGTVALLGPSIHCYLA